MYESWARYMLNIAHLDLSYMLNIAHQDPIEGS
jgi:hypothetical protein